MTDSLPVVLSAPAKLTLSLRVVGVREDGLHLIDAEMVTVDLVDTLRIGDGDGVTFVGPEAEGLEPGGDLVTRALALVGRHRLRGGRQAHSQRRRAGWRVGRRRGHPAVGRVRRRRGRGPPRCGRPVLRARGPGSGHRRRRGVAAVAPRGPHVHAADAAASTAPRRRSTRHGTTWVGRRGRTATTWSPRRWPSCRNWRDGATSSRKLTGAVPMLAGSGSTWFVEGSFPGEGRRVVHTLDPPRRSGR